MTDELKVLVRERIGKFFRTTFPSFDAKTVSPLPGPFAQPDVIQNAPGLPKTRSGKIMRRVLRKVAVNDRDVGDISTLADEAIVDQLFANRPSA